MSEQRIIRARIAAIVAPDGSYDVRGYGFADGNEVDSRLMMEVQDGSLRSVEGARAHWIEVDLPVPRSVDDAATITGKVESATGVLEEAADVLEAVAEGCGSASAERYRELAARCREAAP